MQQSSQTEQTSQATSQAENAAPQETTDQLVARLVAPYTPRRPKHANVRLTLIKYDVWADGTDGYTVNDMWQVGACDATCTVDVFGHPTTRSVLRQCRLAGLAVGKGLTEDRQASDGWTIVLQTRNGRPVGEIRITAIGGA